MLHKLLISSRTSPLTPDRRPNPNQPQTLAQTLDRLSFRRRHCRSTRSLATRPASARCWSVVLPCRCWPANSTLAAAPSPSPAPTQTCTGAFDPDPRCDGPCAAHSAPAWLARGCTGVHRLTRCIVVCAVCVCKSASEAVKTAVKIMHQVRMCLDLLTLSPTRHSHVFFACPCSPLKSLQGRGLLFHHEGMQW